MRIRKTAGALIIVALAGSHETVSFAFAGDEIVDSVAGVIQSDGPEVSGQPPEVSKRSKTKNRRPAPAPAATPIWELDGPPIDRAGVDGR
jgi:hypothetical protein